MTELHTLDDLEREAKAFAAQLSPHANGATLVTLTGELGAGKTSFTQALARALGVTDYVTSPTFVLEKIYALPQEHARGFTRFVHIDAYRLASGTELEPLGFEDILHSRENLIVLEWPERVSDTLPRAEHALTFTVQSDGTRTLSYA